MDDDDSTKFYENLARFIETIQWGRESSSKLFSSFVFLQKKRAQISKRVIF